MSRGGHSRQARRRIVPGATAWWSAANPLNTISGGTNVTTYADLSGNARDLTQGTSSKRPTYGSGAGDTFDGADDQLGGATWTNFITASDHTIYIAFTPLAWSTTAAIGAADANHGVLADPSAWLGISMRNVASNEIMCWASSAGYKGLTLPATLNTPLVVTYRHTGGTIYGSVNGGAEVSAVCGNIGSVGTAIQMGKGYSQYANVKTFECVTYNVSNSAAEIAHNVAFIRGKWGI